MYYSIIKRFYDLGVYSLAKVKDFVKAGVISSSSSKKSQRRYTMKQKLSKLIDVKSIVTLFLTAVFCVLALRRTISAEQFITVFTVVISFLLWHAVSQKKVR
ncbi:MAG: XkdX family protein [Ruminococcus sp.]